MKNTLLNLVFTVLCSMSFTSQATEEISPELMNIFSELDTTSSELRTCIKNGTVNFEENAINLAIKVANLFKQMQQNSNVELANDELENFNALCCPLSLTLAIILEENPQNCDTNIGEAMLCKYKKIVEQYTSAPDRNLTKEEIDKIKKTLVLRTQNPFICLVGGCNCEEEYRLEKTPYNLFLSFLDQLEPKE